MSWNPRFRLTKPEEKPHRSTGDQFQDIANGYWILTTSDGTQTARELGGRYRRPKICKRTDTSEETATFNK